MTVNTPSATFGMKVLTILPFFNSSKSSPPLQKISTIIFLIDYYVKVIKYLAGAKRPNFPSLVQLPSHLGTERIYFFDLISIM